MKSGNAVRMPPNIESRGVCGGMEHCVLLYYLEECLRVRIFLINAKDGIKVPCSINETIDLALDYKVLPTSREVMHWRIIRLCMQRAAVIRG